MKIKSQLLYAEALLTVTFTSQIKDLFRKD